MLLLLSILGCEKPINEKPIKRMLCGNFVLIGGYGVKKNNNSVVGENSSRVECSLWGGKMSGPGLEGETNRDCLLGAEDEFYSKNNITSFNIAGSYKNHLMYTSNRHHIEGCFIAK